MIASSLVAFSCSSAPEPAAAVRKIVISYPNKSGSQWPLYLAKETGAYAKYGLDVQLEFRCVPGNIAALVSGQSQMVNTSLEQDMQAGVKGRLDGPDQQFAESRHVCAAVEQNIKTVEQLKGKKIAVTQIGDAPYGYVVSILAKAGLKDRDVEWIPVGGPASGRAAAPHQRSRRCDDPHRALVFQARNRRLQHVGESGRTR